MRPFELCSMVVEMSERTRHAEALFAPLGPTYDRVGAVLSFGQDPRWRRFLVERLPRDGGHVLDVATGTGLVAAALVTAGYRVTGIDQSAEMLASAQARFANQPTGDQPVELVHGRAEALPFADSTFDHLTFTYLLRYVDSPAETMRELVRVVRPGGRVAMLEFGVPGSPWRALWELYCGAVLPLAGRTVSRGWWDVGRFLGPSIKAFHRTYPPSALTALWHDAGLEDIHSRRMSLGGGLVMWATKATTTA